MKISEMKYYGIILNISYKKDHVTNGNIRDRTQSAIRDYDELIWPHLKVFWHSQNDSTRRGERKLRRGDRRRNGKTILKSGLMDDLRLYILFNNISVISGRWVGDYERLCAMEPRLRLKRPPDQAGLKPGTARSAGKHLTH